MKTSILKLANKRTLSFESIYQNKGFAEDAYHFSMIEPQKKERPKRNRKFINAINVLRIAISGTTFTLVLLLWFTFYFVVFGTIYAFTSQPGK